MGNNERFLELNNTIPFWDFNLDNSFFNNNINCVDKTTPEKSKIRINATRFTCI